VQDLIAASGALREPFALIRMLARYWFVTYPLLRSNLRAWERRAAAIPDPQLREAALATLRRERLNAAGAALFSALSARFDPRLLRLLIAYQVIWDYLDTLAERPAENAIANASQLHLALVDALVPDGRRSDYYRLHAARDDGGYLAELVETCQSSCGALPAYDRVRRVAIEEARLAGAVQAANHGPAPTRVSVLRESVDGARAGLDVAWFELAAAASSSLGIHALLTAAADADTTATTAELVRDAYAPWICALSTMLDSLVDEAEDAVSGEISFIAHYVTRAHAIARLHEIAARSLNGARGLPLGERHAVIVAGTIAMYLSKSSAWTADARAATIAVLRAGGPIGLPLLMILRAWRLCLTPSTRAPLFNSE
jgi:tetraprenyl-beta-curcumene synthase